MNEKRDWGPGAPKPELPSQQKEREAKRAKRHERGKKKHEDWKRSQKPQ